MRPASEEFILHQFSTIKRKKHTSRKTRSIELSLSHRHFLTLFSSHRCNTCCCFWFCALACLGSDGRNCSNLSRVRPCHRSQCILHLVGKENCQRNVLNSQWTDYETGTWAQKLCRRRREKKWGVERRKWQM